MPRADANQSPIVTALREAMRSVLVLSQVGRGAPDLLVGHVGQCARCRARMSVNTLMEIKTAAGDLSTRQVDFHATWRGPIVTARTIDEALRLSGGY